jgi:hypothetical protein
MKAFYRRILSFAFSLLVMFAALTLSGSPTPALAAGTIMVGCGGSSQPTISAAVALTPNAPAAAGTIKVCPGTYTEQVFIVGKKNLKLLGLATATSPVIVTTAPNVSGATITVFASSGVTIQGFVVHAQFRTPGSISQAILYSLSSGTITKNTIRYVGDNAGSTASLATVDSNAIDGIRVVGPGPGAVKITANTIVNAQHRGIAIYKADNTTVSKNFISIRDIGNHPTAILIENSNGAMITGNTIEDARSSGLQGVAIELNASNNNSVKSNSLRNLTNNFHLTGYCTDTDYPSTDGNTFQSNKIYEARSTIFSLNADDNACAPSISHNTFKSNTIYGRYSIAMPVFAIYSGTVTVENWSFVGNSFNGYSPLSLLLFGTWTESGTKFTDPIPPGA